MREVNGLKIAFVTSESYFASMTTPSMHSTAKATGADVVLLLAPGKKEEDISDEDIRILNVTTRIRNSENESNLS